MKIKKQIPNLITVSRIIALILGMFFFIKEEFTISILLYIYGAVSDGFDGYFARKFDAYSKLGKYLDAVSDKFYLLSIIILVIMNGNYLVIIPAFMEALISIVNYITILKRKDVYTERIGKIKTAIEFPMMIAALIATHVYIFYYIFIILLLFTVYFQIQSIIAYINQKNNKSKEIKVDYKEKKLKEKVNLLIKEFMNYLFHPVKKIK